MKRVLLSGVGGSLFPYLFERLGAKYELFGIDSNPLLKHIYPRHAIAVAPPVSDPHYESFVSDLIVREAIEVYIPLIDEELPKAHRLAREFPNLLLVSPRIDFVSLCLDKLSLMQRLIALELGGSEALRADGYKEEFAYPVFLKPICGRGSRGALKILSKAAFDAYFVLEGYAKEVVMVQPFLEGEEYSVSVVVNQDNKLLSIVPKKILQKRGITISACTQREPAIQKLCERIVALLQPCGSFNVQLKLHQGVPKIFEINPRFSTTTILSMEAGVDEFALMIEGANQVCDFQEGVHIFRRWESHFYV